MIINLTKLLEIPLCVVFISPPKYDTTGWLGNLSNEKTSKGEPYAFDLESET